VALAVEAAVDLVEVDSEEVSAVVVASAEAVLEVAGKTDSEVFRILVYDEVLLLSALNQWQNE
jgi:hypothetical protein